ncbi:MAG: excinuclease ABC subunit UvrC [Bacteroidia bacterium]|nr:excinuclease ABC subunit UvrC [Bacteroidia bacterium]
MKKNKKNIDFNVIISGLPDSPGVYQFLDINGKIIYVGKAKNLKKRVSSYFQKTHDNAKTDILVNRIAEINHIVVGSEQDALLLENNLIKKLQPRYNVLLKDDKTFPWICIKNEKFPRVFLTRNIIKDGSQYFGPYTSARMVRVILEMIRHLYNLRTCSHLLSSQNIENRKFKVCLEYHIGNCKAPCIGNQSLEEYDQSIDQIRNLLKGNINSVSQFLKERMKGLSEEYRFEEAEQIKEKILLLEKFQSKSTIVNPSINNVDVFSIVDDDKRAFVNFMKVMNGAIIQAHTIEMVKRLNESKEELLPIAIIEIWQMIQSRANEIILPFEIEFLPGEITITVPKIGDKKKLLDLSQRNAKHYQAEVNRMLEEQKKPDRTLQLMEIIRNDLRLTELPSHIECFDNSNFQGKEPVAACVVFKNLKPSKNDYRHFNIKTVRGINDFESMEEVVYRRYLRLTEEKTSLPQLIIIDGGKGQLSSALKALEKLNLRGKISIIGIAKRLEEIYYADDPIPLYLDKKSETLKLIQRIRDEAHRFGIGFHRDKRSKSFINSELENIKGIGENTIQLLFSEFKTIETILSKSTDELSGIIGKSRALLIKDYFNKKLM